ncbi:ABC transporter ATP-binding protein [Lichenicoccus roseus]|uniref:ABC transporter ATP-binding protein n=1 Tax=Lichenicoccus roseus TaxID=2683649 RepID=A0A5R9J967_9PROT|nr:ABC transporter ATP-binding protein [Lichenicoccus roseus]TLU73539.1 ABC transporter ATP-binding protein [Lichenicoccus roseus]
MAGVTVQDLHIAFPLYHASARSLKRAVAAATSNRLREDAQHRVVVNALRGVSFTLQPGDRLGLVGGNGAGKTTLLRALAGIYEPIAGHVVIRGALHTLLDTGLGMNMDLTGRENIGLRGLYAGLERAAIALLEDDVQAFAELGGFLDMPVRTYSSGMLVRLGFALATAIDPQVLLMDEWFLAGDSGFMAKARQRLEALVRKAEILVLSTHNPEVIASWCNRVLWLEQGTVRMDGAPIEVLEAYLGHPVEATEDLLLSA